MKEDDFSSIRELSSKIVKDTSPRQAIAHAVFSLVRELKTQGIIVPTINGTTAQVQSANRPASPLAGVFSDAETCRKLALHWGIIPYKVKEEDTHGWKLLSKNVARRFNLTRTGNMVLLVSGFDKDPENNEPVIKILKV
jgi:pyruvate kinase